MHRQSPTTNWSIIKAFSETALVLVLLGVAAGMWVGRPAHRLATEPAADALNRTSPFVISGTLTAPPPRTSGKTMRRIYGHSLVAGGIHSVDELVAVSHGDPLLAEHYKSMDLSKAHIITLDHDAVAYVSYRLGPQIYWQARATIIATGEQVITDGTHFVRVRCGNQISYDRGLPTRAGEPEDVNSVVELKLVEPAETGDGTAGYGAAPGPDASGSGTHSRGGNPSGGPAQQLSGGSLGAPAWGISGGNAGAGGGDAPLASPIVSRNPPSNPPSQFSADEFPTISFTVFGHSCHVPSELAVLLTGLLLAVTLRWALWR